MKTKELKVCPIYFIRYVKLYMLSISKKMYLLSSILIFILSEIVSHSDMFDTEQTSLHLLFIIGLNLYILGFF